MVLKFVAQLSFGLLLQATSRNIWSFHGSLRSPHARIHLVIKISFRLQFHFDDSGNPYSEITKPSASRMRLPPSALFPPANHFLIISAALIMKKSFKAGNNTEHFVILDIVNDNTIISLRPVGKSGSGGGSQNT
ncbi:hypothetical protein Zmor_008144 [Zophobas morio]|uniref:Uncharacterized protein n=1 Tax=Zophobas morio TaxID=2755281 RepID=A0AA38J3Q5_9CUCU|nr:hypothetical protein Zmor_008144 [Zophobas morio]